jgi:hypothetical protein
MGDSICYCIPLPPGQKREKVREMIRTLAELRVELKCREMFNARLREHLSPVCASFINLRKTVNATKELLEEMARNLIDSRDFSQG